MALTAQQIKARDGKLTASRVAVLMNGDDEGLYELWLELTGDPSFVTPDFSKNWHVRLGETTEQLNLDWFAMKYGPVSGRGKVLYHPEHQWAAATLDGWSDDHACPIECKHLIGFEKTEDCIIKYMPQMTWQMIVTDAEQCAFSPIQGGREPDVRFVPFDKPYATELWKRATAFMKHVHDLTPPVAAPRMDAEAKVEPVKIVDMSANKDWMREAKTYAAFINGKKTCEKAEKALKKIIPEDAKITHGAGIHAVRNKAGAVSIKIGDYDGKSADQE